MNFKRSILLGLVLGTGLWVRHLSRLPETRFGQTAAQPRLVLEKAVVVGWDAGKRLWKFSGDEMTVDHENHYLSYKGHGEGILFFGGKPFVKIYSPRLQYDLISKNARASEGVRLFANPSTSLRAGELSWNQTTQRLYVPGRVEIRSPCGFFSGRRMLLMAYEGRVLMQSVRMKVNVKVPAEFDSRRP